MKNTLDGLRIVMSSLLIAIVVNCFFMFNHLAPGGITGLSLVISSVTHIDISIISLSISIPMLLLSTYVMGRNFGAKTVFVVLMTPLFMRIVPKIWLLKSLPPVIELLISAIIGGLIIGTSISLALKSNAATGGTDVLALLVQKLIPNVALSKIVFVLDGLIILSTTILHKNIYLGLFSLVSLGVIVNTINFNMKKIAP